MTTDDLLQQATARPWILLGNTAWAEGCKDRGAVCACALVTGTHILVNQNMVNAELITRAVNSFEAMRHALSLAQRWLVIPPAGTGYLLNADYLQIDGHTLQDSLTIIQAALALAEGNSHA